MNEPQPTETQPTEPRPHDVPKIVAVLGYHKIGSPPRGTWTTWNYVAVERFREHLEMIRDGGWDVIDVSRLLDGLKRPERLGPRSVLVTFDDACRSLLHVAAPELARFSLPSVVFVPTDFIGKTNTFDDGAEPEEPIMTWDELHAVREFGMEVQSHGVSHRTFSALPADTQAHELGASRALLEEALGTDVHTFAFPFGDAADRTVTEELLASAGYHAAFLYGGGAIRLPGAPRFALPRIPVGADTDIGRQLAKAAALASE